MYINKSIKRYIYIHIWDHHHNSGPFFRNKPKNKRLIFRMTCRQPQVEKDSEQKKKEEQEAVMLTSWGNF